MTIIWNSETNKITPAWDYEFNTKVTPNIFDGEDYKIVRKTGFEEFTKDKYECLTFWDHAVAWEDGFAVYCFELKDAIHFVIDIFSSCEDDKDNALILMNLMKQIAYLKG